MCVQLYLFRNAKVQCLQILCASIRKIDVANREKCFKMLQISKNCVANHQKSYIFSAKLHTLEEIMNNIFGRN